MSLSPDSMYALTRVKSVPEGSFDSLAHEVSGFQAELPADCELGISVSGSDRILHVQSIRLAGQMVVFEGVVSDGSKARVIQHYTQVNVQMIAVKPITDTPNRIGFLP